MNSHPAADMIERISSSGIAMMRRNRRSDTVRFKASSRAAGSMVLEISQSMSSTSTVANAMVAENVHADMVLMLTRLRVDVFDAGLLVVGFLFEDTFDRRGSNLWETTVATKKKVIRNGREENIIAVEACALRPMDGGVQPLQSVSAESIGSSGSRDEHNTVTRWI